jgi:FKBP-type peptidyl-prolyl cis-trans isomerase
MLQGFSIEGSHELRLPKDVSIILHTVTSSLPQLNCISVATKHHTNAFTVAYLTQYIPNATLQYPISHEDCPITLNVHCLSHFVISCSKKGNIHDWIKPTQTTPTDIMSAFVDTHTNTLVDTAASTDVKQLTDTIDTSNTRSSKKRCLKQASSDPSVKESNPLEQPSTAPAVQAKPDTPAMQAEPIVKASKAPINIISKPWKIKASSDADGIAVPFPKQLTKSCGVKFTDYIVGKKPFAKQGAPVKVIYQAYYTNGTLFDEHLTVTKPFTFRLGAGQVIRGLDLGIEGMRIGGSREIIIPPELG